jgi:hypothetical protein
MVFYGPLWNSCRVRKLKGNGLFYAIFMVLSKVRKLRGNGLNCETPYIRGLYPMTGLDL